MVLETLSLKLTCCMITSCHTYIPLIVKLGHCQVLLMLIHKISFYFINCMLLIFKKKYFGQLLFGLASIFLFFCRTSFLLSLASLTHSGLTVLPTFKTTSCASSLPLQDFGTTTGGRLGL